jgi:hypothetical protein
MMTLGIDFGGPGLSREPVGIALIATERIAMRVREVNYDDGTEGWINPIYIVPGSVSQPDFEGYKLGYFSKKKKGLVVQIAVPQSVADGEGIPEFIGTSLREAVRLAASHFATKGMSFSTLKAEKIILAIEDGLAKLE